MLPEGGGPLVSSTHPLFRRRRRKERISILYGAAFKTPLSEMPRAREKESVHSKP